ncbi:MAG: hypothetical protein JXR40_02150 [Pontiellaceae bacterium]|nr:hypothetical protein [Pontiellaceae bacterium]
MRHLLCCLAGLSFLLSMTGCKRKSAYIPEKVPLIRVDDSGDCFEGTVLLDNKALVERVSEYTENMRLLGQDPNRISVQLNFSPDIAYSTARDVERLVGSCEARIHYTGEYSYVDSKETPTSISEIWKEYKQQSGPLPDVSLRQFMQIMEQRLWLKVDGTLHLGDTVVDETMLRELARDRCYLFIEGGDLLETMGVSYYDFMSVSLIVEPGVRYWDVRRIEHLLAMNSCQLQIIDLQGELVDMVKKNSAAVDDRIKKSMDAIGDELEGVLNTMEPNEK